MPQQKSVFLHVFVTTFAVAFISAEVHKGYSHTTVHNKHGGKFSYKIQHVYHPKKHGHVGGGGNGGGSHAHDSVPYKQRSHHPFHDDHHRNAASLLDGYERNVGADHQQLYATGFPTLEDVYHQYSKNDVKPLYKFDRNTFNDIDGHFGIGDNFDKGQNDGYSKSYSYSYPTTV